MNDKTKESTAQTGDRVVEIDIEGIIGTPNEESGAVATHAELERVLQRIRPMEEMGVVVNIRSTGGSVNDALLIYDALRSLGKPITTRCYGYTASAATIIAQAADKGRREISANGLYLIHCSESHCEGNALSVEQTRELLEQTDRRIAEIYASRSGLKAETFLKLMRENNGKGRWLSPQEAVATGLADRIAEAAPISNSAAEQLEKLGLPPLPTSGGGVMEWLGRQWHAMLERLGIESGGMEMPTMSYPREIECLTDRMSRINNGRSAFDTARATTTLPTEDPSSYEAVRSPNSAAYEADALSMRTSKLF